jgi:hypothetical protein
MNWCKKLSILICFVLLVSLTGWTQSASPADFSNLQTVITELRGGEGETLALRVSDKFFTVLRQQTSDISQADGKKLLDSAPKAFPQLKYTDAGYRFRHEIDSDTTIEQPFSKDKNTASPWHKITWINVATYELTEWRNFINFLLAHGLYSFRDYDVRGEHEYVLAFSPATPSSISAGDKTIAATAEFAQHMRVSPKYAPAPGGSGFVVLLHDPHYSVNGRFETLAGLRALLSANKSLNFQFLVEGAYHGDRKIGFAGLDKALDTTTKGRSRPAVVQSLLAHYLIDTPMAYRLLYDRSLPAIAIDDNQLLQYNAPRPMRTPSEQFRSLRNFASAVDKLPVSGEDKKAFISAINMGMIFLEADNSEATDERYVEYYDSLANSYSTLAKSAGMMAKAGIQFNAQADALALGRDALGYEDEREIFKRAVGRNRVMAENIIAAARQASVSLPIAFIGSFHTPGLIKALRENHIGYVVIEPRPKVPVTKAEIEQFDRAIHPNTKGAYRASVRLNKGEVAPSPAVVLTVYRAKMAEKALRAASETSAVENQARLIPGATVRPTEFTRVTTDNGNLSGVKLSFNNGGKPPTIPPEFKGAFAVFDSGNEGRATLMVTDPTDQRWNSQDRYSFLGAVVFSENKDMSEVKLIREETMYTDVADGLIYYTIRDAESGRTYCFEERSVNNIKLSLVPQPHTSEKGFTNIRIQVVEVIITTEEPRG